jgi:alpha-galactosidase
VERQTVVKALAAMLRASLCVVLFFVTAQANDNGVAITPPMGWRSWNCFHGDVSDELMRTQIDALNVKRPVKGANSAMSLLDLGFNRLGIDDGWQACGEGSMVQPGGTFHDSAGKPLVNKTKFPFGLRALTDYASSKGIELGFYWNNVRT